MISFLPIKFVSEEDEKLLGRELISLAYLGRIGFPIPKGLIVFPPAEEFERIVKRNETEERLVRQLFSVRISPELDCEFLKFTNFSENIWNDLLERWIKQIVGQLNLSALPVFVIAEKRAEGQAFYDKEQEVVVINADFGKLDPENERILIEEVKKATQKLLLDYQYDWVLDKNKIKFVKLTPLTSSVVADSLNLKEDSIKKLGKRRGFKLFYKKATSDYVIDRGTDGLILDFEKGANSDQKTLELVESATALAPNPVLVCLSDFGDIKTILFARNKKGLINVQFVLPYVKSTGEFLSIKQEIASLGLLRKGSLKLWLEMALPENLINIEEYLEIGFDGVLLNLDNLVQSLSQTDLYSQQMEETLKKFLEKPLKDLGRQNILVLASGKALRDEQFLSFLVSKGVMGVVLIKDNLEVNQQDVLSFGGA